MRGTKAFGKCALRPGRLRPNRTLVVTGRAGGVGEGAFRCGSPSRSAEESLGDHVHAVVRFGLGAIPFGGQRHTDNYSPFLLQWPAYRQIQTVMASPAARLECDTVVPICRLVATG